MDNREKKARTQPGDSHDTKTDGLLVATAKKIGSAAGAVVSLTGTHETSGHAKIERSPMSGKLQKKNKTRLPRRAKKALGKKQSKNHPVSA